MELQKVNTSSVSLFDNSEVFAHGQRVAKMLSSSDIVPQQYKGNIANTMVALNMANRMNADPMAVMQNLHIIHGRPSWSAPFLISAVNNSGRCSPLRYRFESLGTITVQGKSVENLSCTAWAKDKEGEMLEGTPVTVQMAVSEGWYGKKGSKWPTMTKQMLSYRAASFFARLYFPELTMGLSTADEAYDAVPTVEAGYAETAPTETVLQDLNNSINRQRTETAPTETAPTEETPEAAPTETVQSTEEPEEGEAEWI